MPSENTYANWVLWYASKKRADEWLTLEDLATRTYESLVKASRTMSKLGLVEADIRADSIRVRITRTGRESLKQEIERVGQSEFERLLQEVY